MGKMTVQDVASKLMGQFGLHKKEAVSFVNEIFVVARNGLERDSLLKIKGLGTFKIVDVDDRESVDVNTGERVLIEGHSKITFTPDALMKELVNKPFSQFETVVLRDGVDFDDLSKVDEKDIETPKITPATQLTGEVNEEQYVVDEELVMDLIVEAPSSDNEAVAESDVEETVVEDNPPMAVESKLEIMESAPEVTEQTGETSTLEVEDSSTAEVTGSSTAEIEEPSIAEVEAPSAAENEDPSTAEVEDPSTAEVEDPSAVTPEDPSSTRKSGWLLPSIVSLVAGLLIGFFVGKLYFSHAETDQNVASSKTVSAAQVAKGVPSSSSSADGKETVKAEAHSNNTEAEKQAVPSNTESETQSAAQSKTAAANDSKPVVPEVKTNTAENNDLHAKYAALDARVRTGAYLILGTEEVLKARKGDNISKISKRTLGPGMECYIEVYNGIKANAELTSGQEIKIPKLKRKQKKSKKED